MRRVRCLAVAILVTSALAVPVRVRAATAADKTARGTVVALSADSMTIKVLDKELTFVVDGKTKLVAAGTSAQTRPAGTSALGATKLTETVKAGESVEVTYTDTNGTHLATRVRAVAYDYSKCLESCDIQYAACAKGGDAAKVKYCSAQHDKCRKKDRKSVV